MSQYDVAIIGGGPAGSTTGTLLRKYGPNLSVAIFERENFPRDHVGESQLPGCSAVLHEMGVWDKVEAANFPIKVGATYRWGRTKDLWDFEFYPKEKFVDEPRPAKFEGQRRSTAFQVDRAVYDEILLDHAAEMGCEVHEGARVLEVIRSGDRIDGIKMAGGNVVTAKYYVDASGHSGLLRRAMGVQVDCPTGLQNIAIWDYWQNTDWAERIGVGGTYVQVLSVDFGWIWFIPLGPTRTSIGLVVPASYYKSCGLKPQELYDRALNLETRVQSLLKNATSEGKLQTTKDWSFVSERQAGENWFLVGESAGFADPILAAGLTMTHAAGREAACTILEMLRGKANPSWLREQFSLRQSERIRNHMRFADYWYSSNGIFTELQAHTAEIARLSGLDLEPSKAWAWLAQGGFIGDDLSIGTGTFSLNGVKALSEVLHEITPDSPLENFNVFKLNLAGASYAKRARYVEGQVQDTASYRRGERVLPVDGVFDLLLNVLQRESAIERIMDTTKRIAESVKDNPAAYSNLILAAISGLEAMVVDGWVEPSLDASRPIMDLRSEYGAIHYQR